MFKKYIKKLIKWMIIPLVLFFVAMVLSIIFFFNSDINPNILSQNELIKNIHQDNNLISGKFKASDNYLGIITIRFNKENLSGNSIFKIKNILEDDWYHTATISAVQYYTLPFYSFGFPVIEKSKNQTYQFQIKLLSENRELTLSKQEPVFVSSYAYPKEILLDNFRLLKDFAQKKIDYYFSTQNTWKVFLIYSLPLFFYLLYILALHGFISDKNKNRFKKIFKNFAKPTIITILIVIAIDIFVIRKYTDSTTSWLTLFWIFGVIGYRLEARYSFGFALIFLTFCPFLLVVPMDWIAEKSAVWTYIMLVVGTFQSIFDISPVLQKVVKTKPVQIIIQFIKFVFLIFDRSLINLLNFLNHTFIFYITFIFKGLPRTILGWIIFLVKLTLLIICIFTVFITSTFTILKINNIIKTIHHKKIRLSLDPIIETVEPRLVYKATRIVIYGKKFGWDVKKSQALIDGKKIDATLWTDSKIIFPVPLDWKDGPHKIWIEKRIDWDEKKQTAKSQEFEIKILPITGNYTEDDKLYSEQLKNLKKETLELNGYN